MMVAIFALGSENDGHVAEALAREGLAARRVGDVSEAVGAEVALVLAGADGVAPLGFVAKLREAYPSTPQIVLADRDDVDLRVAAYDAGADCCLSQPFELRELMAKLRALQRRAAQGAAAPLLPSASATIDPAAFEIRMGRESRKLTRREADLLMTLHRASGAVVGRENVLRDAWGAPADVTGNLVDVYVGYARRKLEQIGADVVIKSVRGEGFRLVGKRDFRPKPSARAAETRKK